MKSNNISTITNDLLDTMEINSCIIPLTSEESFFNTIKNNLIIMYLKVNWSGTEMISRYYVYKTLQEINNNGIPVFKIDCSDQLKTSVLEWIIEQRNKKHFHFGGYGEVFLISNNEIIDFINNPKLIGFEKTKQKIQDWKEVNIIKHL